MAHLLWRRTALRSVSLPTMAVRGTAIQPPQRAAMATGAAEGLSRSKKPRYSIWWLATVPAVAFGLGVWQVYRLQWKRGLLEEVHDAARKPPVEIASVLEDASAAEFGYRPVYVRGQFLHDQELFVAPRTHDGEVGAHVITPLRLVSGDTILVDRGWVPRAQLDPSTRSAGQLSGTVKVVGHVRDTKKPSYFTPENVPEKDQWFYIDVARMAASRGTKPLFVQAERTEPSPGRLPVPAPTLIDIPNDHAQYALTWFALSAATAAMIILRLRA